MNNDRIIIRNAHTNNLKNISIEIPKHKIVVFSGVSGSGKSSLLFDTIYTEAQRQLIETFGAFARARLPKLSRPDVDDILNLSTPIVIDQKRMGNNLRSTVGTATELATYLRLLYSRVGQPFLNMPSYVFSFNHPEGMCPHCHGLGKEIKVDLERFLDMDKSLREGAVLHSMYKQNSYMLKELIRYNIFDADKKLKDYSPQELDKLLYSEPLLLDKSTTQLTYNRYFEGIARKLERAVMERANDLSNEDERTAYNQCLTYRTCPHCHGSRLNERARSVTINGMSIDKLFAAELNDVVGFIKTVDNELAKPIVRKAQFILDQLINIGVGYLSLDRPVSTLSGGESQRVKMARQLDCDLTDLLYVLDEPSIGLHPRDTEKLITILTRLRDKGNSVFVVEHDPEIISSAEWIVDIGPKAGKLGGEIVYNGTAEGLAGTNGLTAQYLKPENRCQQAKERRHWNDFYQITNAKLNNLKGISVKIPKGVLTCVTGVAGCGKSSLIHGCFVAEHPEAIVIDQSPIGRTSRGNVISYMGIFDHIRRLFATTNHCDASLFSFNSEGACPKCNGQGVLSYEMHFLDSIKTRCDECGGKRYRPEVLEMKYKGKNIDELLNMTVNQAAEYFDDKRIRHHMELLKKVGLGYLKLGQSLSALSGGESQRLKIATELRKTGNIYVMDEPTTGLHMSDIETLCIIIEQLVAKGNTVVVIEHNLDLIRRADWIIDLGPEGGKQGGEVIFEGTPEQLAECKKSYTGKYLKPLLQTQYDPK